jgi:hypothetical protein
MDGTAVKAIRDLTKEGLDPLVKIDGRTYTREGLTEIHHELPAPKHFTVSTLSGFLDYIKADPDRLITGPVVLDSAGKHSIVGTAEIIQIVSPTKVLLRSRIARDDVHSRFIYLAAECAPPQQKFGQWMTREEFQIYVMTHFDRTVNRDTLLAYVGNVQDDTSIRVKDDGVTQEVTARAGIVLAEKAAWANPTWLSPYRSFPEISPVESPFVFRVKGGGGNGPVLCALFEADGGRWVIDTVTRIDALIRTALADSQAARLLIVR